MRSPLLKRVEKLEAASVGAEVSLGELVEWSMCPEACHPDNPAYVDFSRRFATSRLRRLIEQNLAPYTRGAGPDIRAH
jgi:hypothetical protein